MTKNDGKDDERETETRRGTQAPLSSPMATSEPGTCSPETGDGAGAGPVESGWQARGQCREETAPTAGTGAQDQQRPELGAAESSR